MTNVLILGANGQLARNTTRLFLERTDVRLTLYLRRAGPGRRAHPCQNLGRLRCGNDESSRSPR